MFPKVSIGCTAVGLVVRQAAGEARFPPPDFESGHQLPTTSAPLPGVGWIELIDIVVLVAALAVTSHLVLKRRSRAGVFAVAVCSLFYFGFWRQGCVCAIGSIQNVSLAVFDPGYALPVVVGVFFALPLVFTLIYGRTFCAGVCPLGAIQDVAAVRPVQVPRWLDQSLGLLRYLYLSAAVLFAATGSAFIICRYDPFVGLFRLSGTLNMLLLGGALLVLGMFIVRPYCRYLCPYGVLLGWLSRASKWHARIDPQQCITCHLCADACPVNAIDKPGDAATSPHDAATYRRRFGWTLALLPLLVALGAWAGGAMAPPMSRLHPAVQLAERIYAEETAAVTGVTDASMAFRALGTPIAELYEGSIVVQGRFQMGAPLFGGFMGLVFGGKLIQLARRAARPIYDIDRAHCVACARCFKYCPHDPDNLALLEALTAQQPALVQVSTSGVGKGT